MLVDWYPHYIGDYDVDTMLLTPAEDGVYCRLLRWYYQHERPLPADDASLARIARVPIDDWISYASQIKPLFHLNGNGMLHHKRCDEVLRTQAKKRKDSGARMSRMRKRGIDDI